MDADDLLEPESEHVDSDLATILEIGRLLGEIRTALGPEEQLALAQKCAALLAPCLDATLDIVSDKIRKVCGVTKAGLRDLIDRVRSSDLRASKEVPPPAISPEERGAAEALLKAPDLLKRFVEDTETLGAIGEQENKILLLLTGTSRQLDEPIGVVVKSSSSAGKSHLVEIVASTMPPESRNVFTSASGKSFFHLKKSLAHTLLVMVEHVGTEESEYSIRVLQSEKKIVYIVPQKNPETGEIETVEKQIDGPIAYIETTTRASLHAENETRVFSISINESDEFTRDIMRRQAAKAAGRIKADPEPIRKLWQNTQRILQPGKVIIPYAPLLAEIFPTARLRARRDYPRLLAVIEASALLHQLQRKRLPSGELIADLQDYEVARLVAGKALRHALRGTTEKTERLIAAAWQVAEKAKPTAPESYDLTVSTLRAGLPSSGWSDDTVDRYAKQACGEGYLERTEGGRGKANTYQVRRRLDPGAFQLPTPAELLERMGGSAPPQPSADGPAEVIPQQGNELDEPPHLRMGDQGEGGDPIHPSDEDEEEPGFAAGGHE